MENYKNYSLKNLEKWIEDAINTSEASPQEIFDVIKNVVTDNYYCYKNQTSRCYELLTLLNGGNHIKGQVGAHGELWEKEDVLREREYYEDFDGDKSSKRQKAWNDFWEDNYYPEEVQDDGMRPWGHSDMEYLIANSNKSTTSTCAKSEMSYQQAIDAGYTMTDDGFWIPPQKEDKVVKWILPVQQKIEEGIDDYYIQFPDDLLEAVNLKEGDLVEWIDRGDGSFMLVKVDEKSEQSKCG